MKYFSQDIELNLWSNALTETIFNRYKKRLKLDFSRILFIIKRSKRIIILNVVFLRSIILNKETTTFSLQDMFRHSYVIFSCKCDFNGCTFEFIWDTLQITSYCLRYNLNIKYEKTWHSTRQMGKEGEKKNNDHNKKNYYDL